MDEEVSTKLRRELKKLIEEKYPQTVAAVYLFGSYAKGYARPDSDIDVAVLFRDGLGEAVQSKVFDFVMKAIDNLSRIDDVNLVNLNRAQLLLRRNVVNDGILLYEGDPGERCGFEYQTLVDYDDERFFRQEKLEYTLARIAERGFAQ